MKETKKVKQRKVLANERKRKGETYFDWFFNPPPKKKLDTIVNHQNKHTIENQGCSWSTPVKNCLSAIVFYGVLIRHPIFWEIGHFWEI